MEIGKYRVQWHGPMSLLHANNGVEPRFLKEQEAHKWLSCIVNVAGARRTCLDCHYHLQAASWAREANTQILCDRSVSILRRRR